MAVTKEGLDETTYSLTEHLGELRARIIKGFLGLFGVALACLVFSPQLFGYVIRPLQEVLDDRARVETLLVRPDGTSDEELADRLSSNRDVRFRGVATSLEAARPRVASAAGSRRPIDLLLVDADALGDDGRLASDLLEGVSPTPYVAYLVDEPGDPLVTELQLEGALVVLDPPRPAVLERVLRRAAAAAGKAAGGDSLVVLSPLEPFFAYIKLALVCGLFLSCPIWLYQAWAFVAPGLYVHEKKFAAPVVLSGSILFIAGGLFAYYGMFPVMFDFLVNTMMPDSLVGSFTVDKYLGLLLRITVAFGVVFELPLALALLSALEMVTVARLRRFRKFALIGAFVLGAVLTPADPVSQSMMAAPLVIFYEVGVLLAGLFEKRRAAELARVDDDGDDAGDAE